MKEYPHTFAKINHELSDKEFILQRTRRGYRCISWHPHYIMTDWVKEMQEAISRADIIIAEWYKNHAQ